MIKIIDKKDCCGCNACVQKCPKQCITMQLDDEGFYYPVVDVESCINCGLCKKVCPVLNQGKIREPYKCYAARSKFKEIVSNSSSAGVFFLLAEKTINNNGVVFGARFNDCWDIVHTWTDNIEGLKPFMSSKYVQSQIGNSYQQAEIFLKEGREVLFSGTPCQIAGLHLYLKVNYDNLICVDVICHGVPSPGVWREYLRYEISPKKCKDTVSSPIYSPLTETDALKIKGISFRNKRLGWRKYSFVIFPSLNFNQETKKTDLLLGRPLVQQKHYYNLYMKTFLFNLTLRQSCFACPARKGKSGSDILLGDFWGVARYYPEFFDANGVSMVLCYTEKGVKLLESLDLDRINVSYYETRGNSNIEKDETLPLERKAFFANFREVRIEAMKFYCKEMSGNPLIIFLKTFLLKIKNLIK